MKNILKIIMVFILLMITFLILVISNKDNVKQNISYAATSHTSDIQLMARAINGEARGEPYEGQVAVGAVILNRVKDSRFPNTISGVIYQSGAFTAVSDGQINSPIAEDSTVYKAAQDALNGWDPQVAVYIILIQIQQQIVGYGQDHMLLQSENIDFVNKERERKYE